MPRLPYKEEIRWLAERQGFVVGDLGCGEALSAEAAKERHKVHSFDHVAVNPSVAASSVWSAAFLARAPSRKMQRAN